MGDNWIEEQLKLLEGMHIELDRMEDFASHVEELRGCLDSLEEELTKADWVECLKCGRQMGVADALSAKKCLYCGADGEDDLIHLIDKDAE